MQTVGGGTSGFDGLPGGFLLPLGTSVAVDSNVKMGRLMAGRLMAGKLGLVSTGVTPGSGGAGGAGGRFGTTVSVGSDPAGWTILYSFDVVGVL